MGETSEIVLLVMNLWLQVAESDYLDKIFLRKSIKNRMDTEVFHQHLRRTASENLP